MGFAIHEPGDEVTVRLVPGRGVKLIKITGDCDQLSRDTHENAVSIPVKAMYERLELNCQVEIELRKCMPIGSGLGSSAASSVAGTFALNEILEKKFPKEELLQFALQGERFTSGSDHADNVAACLYGGFVLVRNGPPLDVVPVKTPDNLVCTVISPKIEVRTKDARKLLPEAVPLTVAVTQLGNAAAMVSGLMRGDMNVVGRAMKDLIAEPVRAKLIPGYDKMKQAALDAGAIGCGISGSGPSMFALSGDEKAAMRIGRAMKMVLEGLFISCSVYISRINTSGPRIIGQR
jgi:homoserine kinase